MSLQPDTYGDAGGGEKDHSWDHLCGLFFPTCTGSHVLHLWVGAGARDWLTERAKG